MLNLEDFIDDFDRQQERILHLRMDDRCYELRLSYVPFLEITDYVNIIDNLERTIKLVLLLTTEDNKIQNILVTVCRNEDEKFRIQTLHIIVTKVFPSNTNNYEDILPPRLESKGIKHNNIKRLLNEVKSFDEF